MPAALIESWAGHANSSATTFQASKPAGALEGHLLLAHVLVRGGNGSGEPVSTPSGWTMLRNDTTANSSSGLRSWLFYKFVGPAEPATYTFSCSATRIWSAGISAWSGINTSLPFGNAGANVSQTATAALTSPSVTTPLDSALLLWFGSARASAPTLTTPGGMTELYNEKTTLGTDDIAVIAAYETLAGPNSSGTRQGSSSPAAIAVAQSLLLNPADQNFPPTANAGTDKQAAEGVMVTLDGSGSSDPEGALTFQWTQIAGSTTAITDATSATASVTPATAGTRTFRLTITDSGGLTAQDDMVVTTLPAGVSFFASSGTSATATATMPAGAQTGDLAIIVLATTPVNRCTSAITGWDYDNTAANASSSTDVNVAIYQRVLGESIDPTVSFTLAQSGSWICHAVIVSGMHATKPWLADAKPATKILSPSNITASITGTAGTTSRTYVVTAVDAAGEHPAATSRVVSNSPAVLSNTDKVVLVWATSDRARTYNVYRDGQKIGVADRTNVTGVTSNYLHGFTDTGQTPVAQAPTSTVPLYATVDAAPPDDVQALVPLWSGASLFAAFAVQITAGNAAYTISEPAEMQRIGYTLHSANRLALLCALEPGLTANEQIPERMAALTSIGNWATLGAILRPAGANTVPISDAGPDFDVFTGKSFSLNGARSYDKDGDALTYSWSQIAGQTLNITGANTVGPTVAAPSQAGTLTFRLTVSDTAGAVATDDVTVTVRRRSVFRVKIGGQAVEVTPNLA